MDTDKDLSDHKKRKRSKDHYLNRWHPHFYNPKSRVKGVGLCILCEEPVSTSLIRIGSTHYHVCRMSLKHFMRNDESMSEIYVGTFDESEKNKTTDPKTKPMAIDYRFERNFTRNELDNMNPIDRFRMIAIEELIDEERATMYSEEQEDWYKKEVKEVMKRLKSDKRECMDEIRVSYERRRKTKRLKRDIKEDNKEEKKERDKEETKTEDKSIDSEKKG